MSAPGVLFIVNSLETGGAEKQLVTLLNRLDAGRFRLHLAYLKRKEQLLPQLDRQRLARILCCDVARRIDGKAVQRLREIIAGSGIDAVICTNSYSTLYGQLALRGIRDGRPLAAIWHTTVLRSPKEKMQMPLYRRLFSRCDLLIYVCESQRRHWRERGVRPPADEVIYNGIDTDWYVDARAPEERQTFRRSLGFDDSDYVVGLCSALRPEKAHGDLLAAVGRLRSQGIPAKALLIGDGPTRPAIERTAAQLGLREHVLITGMKEDVRPLVASCDVMTLVSRSETFSLAALESMSLGKPLVMSNVGGACEQLIHGEHGFLFEPADVEALAMRLTALTSPSLRARLGQAAASRVREQFNVHAMAARFTRCIVDLLREPAEPLATPSVPDRPQALSR